MTVPLPANSARTASLPWIASQSTPSTMISDRRRQGEQQPAQLGNLRRPGRGRRQDRLRIAAPGKERDERNPSHLSRFMVGRPAPACWDRRLAK